MKATFGSAPDYWKPLLLTLALAVAAPVLATAQPIPMPGAQSANKKKEPNPCADEVAKSLQKLRKSSWFRMDTHMITENGPTRMQIDYILPDRMHQTVTVIATGKSSEVVLVGAEAWSKQGDGAWTPVPFKLTETLKAQMSETVLQEQDDVGNYQCKGRTQVDGKDVFSYKLESEPNKDGGRQNDTFRMFYVDAVTGLPASAALLVPGREDKPIFKTTYSYPLDLKIDPPKDVAKAHETPQAGAPAASPAPSAAPAQPEKK